MALLNAMKITAFVVFITFLSKPLQAPGAVSDEYALMALYTYNFAKFTDWPSTSFAASDAPLNFCILGDDPFGMALVKIEGKNIKRHLLRIKHYPRVAVISACHIVFISRSEHARLQAILQALAGRPILTVSDIPDFARHGGMIGLETVAKRVRFSINSAAVSRAGLKLSSKLLELAQTVHNG